MRILVSRGPARLCAAFVFASSSSATASPKASMAACQTRNRRWRTSIAAWKTETGILVSRGPARLCASFVFASSSSATASPKASMAACQARNRRWRTSIAAWKTAWSESVSEGGGILWPAQSTPIVETTTSAAMRKRLIRIRGYSDAVTSVRAVQMTSPLILAACGHGTGGQSGGPASLISIHSPSSPRPARLTIRPSSVQTT